MKVWKKREKINEGGACRLIRNDVSVFRHINFHSWFFSFSFFIFLFQYIQFYVWNEWSRNGNLPIYLILNEKKKSQLERGVERKNCRTNEKRELIRWGKSNKGKSIYVGADKTMVGCLCVSERINLYSYLPISFKELW